VFDFDSTSIPNQPSTGTSPQRSGDIDELKFQNERLLMITEALFNLLQQKTGATEADLVREMVAIDLRDGKLDNRVAKDSPRTCPKCQRTIMRNRARCLYCGEPIAPAPFAR